MTRLRVLLIDDDESLLRAMQRALRWSGWILTAVLGGPEGLAAVQRGEFDVLVTDLEMQDVAGAEILAAAARVAPLAYRILLTASNETLDRTLAHVVVRKPDVDRLRRVVEGFNQARQA